MEITYELILQRIGDDSVLQGDISKTFINFAPIGEAREDEISWVRPGGKVVSDEIRNSKAGCIICNRETYEILSGGATERLYIVTEKPHLIFVKLLQVFAKAEGYEQESNGELYIHPTAVVDADARLGKGVRIGAYSVIDACTIGDNSIIGEYVRIFKPVTIGNNCVIREHCSIGGAGFGIFKDEDGNNAHVPHIGSVAIGNGVHIFPYTNVDRGTLSCTSIGDYTAVDHYCHISHNTTIGTNTIVTAQVVMAGGSSIGDRCFIGLNTILRDKAVIGSDVTTGMGALVVEDIPDGQTWLGQPAMPFEKFRAARKFIKSNV